MSQPPSAAHVGPLQPAQVASRFYAAATGQAPWGDALRGLTETGLCHSAHIFVLRNDNHIPLQLSYAVPEEGKADYAAHFVHCDPRLQFLQSHPGLDAYFDLQFATPREIDRSEYHTWMEKLSCGPYFLGAVLDQHEDERILVSLHRSRRAGSPGRADLALFAQLREHLGHAVRLARLLDVQTDRQQDLRTLLDAAGPCLILDHRARVVYANAAAQLLLHMPGPFDLANGGLRLRDPGDDQRFLATIRAAFTQSPHQAATRLVIAAQSPTSAGSLVLRVVSLPARTGILGVKGEGRLAVFIEDSGASVGNPGLLRSLGLTARELQLVQLLAQGRPLKRAAAEMNVSYNTARLHLARAMAKSRTHRQADLIRLALDRVDGKPAAG